MPVLLLTAMLVGAVSSLQPSVKNQLQDDLIQFIQLRGQSEIESEQLKGMAQQLEEKILTQFPNALEFGQHELTKFDKGQCPYSDKEIQKAFVELRKEARGRPLPVLAEFYQGLFASGSLNGKQKTIYYRLLLAMIVNTKNQQAK